MYPDAMDVGSNLEESLCFLQFHQEITAKYHSKKPQIVESILKQEPNANLTYLWTESDTQVELRARLLQQAVKFHRCARSVGLSSLYSIDSKKIYFATVPSGPCAVRTVPQLHPNRIGLKLNHGRGTERYTRSEQ